MYFSLRLNKESFILIGNFVAHQRVYFSWNDLCGKQTVWLSNGKIWWLTILFWCCVYLSLCPWTNYFSSNHLSTIYVHVWMHCVYLCVHTSQCMQRISFSLKNKEATLLLMTVKIQFNTCFSSSQQQLMLVTIHLSLTKQWGQKLVWERT